MQENKHDGINYPQTLEQLRNQQNKLKERFEPKFTDLPEEYARKLNGEPGQEADIVSSSLNRAFYNIHRPQKELNQVLSYDDAKVIVWEIGKGILEQSGKKWMVDKHSKPVIENIIRYFICDPAGEYDLSKGLYLFGDVGRGKTFLMRVMQVFCQAVPIEKRKFKTANCADIVDELLFLKDNAGLMDKYVNNDTWLFDDMGNEPGAVKSYGNEILPMERILIQRYVKFVNGFCITHVTSNDTPEELEAKYGTRLADRATEMFNFIFLQGESKRK